MNARLAIIILAAPLLAGAAEGDVKGPGASGLTTVSASDIRPATVAQALPRQDVSHAAWPAVQTVPSLEARTSPAVTSATSLSADSLPSSGLQFYALIAAGVAAVGFMASRRSGS
jgi:hypothetical protein